MQLPRTCHPATFDLTTKANCGESTPGSEGSMQTNEQVQRTASTPMILFSKQIKFLGYFVRAIIIVHEK